MLSEFTDCMMEDQLRRRMRALQMTVSFHTWRESFDDPENYRPELFTNMGLSDDFDITFGYRGGRVRVPLSLFCSISSELHFLILTKPRRGLSIYLKGEPAYPFWWLRRFLQHKTPLPGVEGTALVFLMARKYCIESLFSMCRKKLCFYLRIDNFPHVYNAAVEAQDELLLDRCSTMVAAWTDELLSLPSLSVLTKKAMLELLVHPNLSPSSELYVFNAVVNWWKSRGGKCVDDVSFLEDLRSCMFKVKLLLLTEQEFSCHVLPSGVFPFEDVDAMLGMIRKDKQQECREPPYYIHDIDLQGTSRPNRMNTVCFGVNLTDVKVDVTRHVYTKNVDDRPIAWFTVNKLCYIRSVSSPAILDDCCGTLTVKNRYGSVATQKWIRCCSNFEQPLLLQPNISYDLVHTSRTGQSDEECSVKMNKTVGGVTFEGLLYCRSLTLEFITTQESELESENEAGRSRTDSMEIIEQSEVEMAKRHLAAAEQRGTQNGGAKGLDSGKQNGEGGKTRNGGAEGQDSSMENGHGIKAQNGGAKGQDRGAQNGGQAAAKREKVNEDNQEPVMRIASPEIFRELLDDALKEA